MTSIANNAAGAVVPITTSSSSGSGANNGGPATSSTVDSNNAQNTQLANNPQQQQQAKELNAASLCRYGQETVQEIVSRAQELYQTLRGAQPPDGKSSALDRKPKFQETLRNIRALFKRLRVIYDKISESFPDSDDINLEESIPYCAPDGGGLASTVEPMNEKHDTEAYRLAMEEYREVTQQVIFKNRHLRETMDLMRNIIWDINTMLAMRKE